MQTRMLLSDEYGLTCGKAVSYVCGCRQPVGGSEAYAHRRQKRNDFSSLVGCLLLLRAGDSAGASLDPGFPVNIVEVDRHAGRIEGEHAAWHHRRVPLAVAPPQMDNHLLVGVAD